MLTLLFYNMKKNKTEIFPSAMNSIDFQEVRYQDQHLLDIIKSIDFVLMTIMWLYPPFVQGLMTLLSGIAPSFMETN